MKKVVSIRQASQSGFTLIELLISVAIIGIITMIVLLKYSSFDSTTLLKGAAYEVALTIREAQVKSVSVLRNGNDPEAFDFPYGVSFWPGQKTYTMFQFKDIVSLDDNDNPENNRNPRYGVIDVDDGIPPVDVGTVTLERSLQVSNICFMVGGTWNCSVDDSNIDRLDISFRRPEFTALFYVEGYSGDEKDISRVKIEVTSTTGSGTFIIEVSRLGQITVTPE